MKTYKKKYYQKKRTFKKRGGAGAAADYERFKCPFCDKTYSAMSNVYDHCKKKHSDQPKPKLTYATTVVRGADAVAARLASERRSTARWLARDQFVAANGPERFKCPFCDKTYTEITNIYGHCRRKQSGRPMVRLTYDNTIVRPDPALAPPAAAAAAAIAHPVVADRRRRIVDSDDSGDDEDARALAAESRRRHAADDAALAAPHVSYRAAQIHRDLARIQQERQNLVDSRARRASAAAAAPAPPVAAAAHPPPPPVAAAALAAAAPVRVGRIVSRTGTLQGNRDYMTNPVMIPNFPTSGSKLQRNSTYMDWIEMDEKNVLDALNGDPNTLAFKIGGSFCVITKDELFTLMNNADSIKYECNRICRFDTDGISGITQSAEKGVPYLSLGSFSMFQGLVSFFDLWHIISSQQPQQSQAYEFVELPRPPMLSIASHNFLFGPGAAGNRAVSAAHCQAGQDASTVYEIRILPIHTHSRSRAATTIQRIVRGHRSRKNR